MADDKALVPAGQTGLQEQKFHNLPIQLRTLDEYLKLGDVLFKSGYFGDVKSAAQAVAKMIAGAEMGFGPMASLSGVYIQGSRPSFMANLIAAAVKKNGYDYSVDFLDEKECKLTFYGRGGKLLGVSQFTMADAAKAMLTTGKNAHSWSHFPRNMLFSRAISNGARWYCPDIFGGVTPYSPDELDMVVDGETGEVVMQSMTGNPNGSTPTHPEPTKPTPPTPTPVTPPEPEKVGDLEQHFGTPSITERERLQKEAQEKQSTAKFWDGEKWVEKPADESIKLATGTWFSQHFMGAGKAFENTYALFGQPSQKDVAKRGHLGKHYGRTDFVNPKSAMTWREFSELVAYAWWQQGDKEHGTLSLPRYEGKLKEELDRQDAIPYDEHAKSVVPTSADVVEERAKKLGVDIVTLAQAAFTAELVPQLSSATERQLQTLWQVLDAVELGNVKADDFDGQLEMIMLN